MKQKIIKSIFVFLGVILACTIISKSIYNYLLPVVKTTKVQEGSVQVQYIATGKIGLDEEAVKSSQVVLMPSIGGKVIEIGKQEGEEIKKGDTLCVIEKSEAVESRAAKELEVTELTLEEEGLAREALSKKLDYDTLKADYKKKLEEREKIGQHNVLLSLQEQITVQKKNLETTTSLWKEGLVSQQSYEEEQIKLKQLERDLEEQTQEIKSNMDKELTTLERQMEELNLSLAQLEDRRTLNAKKRDMANQTKENETLISPISGFIHTLNVAKGATVSQNDKLAVIVPYEVPYLLSFEVDDIVASKLQMGQEVSFSYGKEPYKAKILKKKFNETTGIMVISCEIALETLEKLNLEKNSYKVVDVKITNESTNYPMLIDNSAIKKVYGSYSVFVIDEQEGVGGSTYKVKEVAVTVLEEGDYKSAISGSLDQDMKIVSSDIGELVDGQEVKLQ